MAEFITKKENTRRLAIIIVCVLADAICAAVIIFAYKKINDLEQSPQNPNRIPELVKKVREARLENSRLERTLLGYGRAIGWKVESTGSNDRFATGEVRNDV